MCVPIMKVVPSLKGQFWRLTMIAFMAHSLSALFPAKTRAQTPGEVTADTSARPAAPRPQSKEASKKPSVFRVKSISDASVYIDAGRNADLQEGMKLSVVEPPPDGVIAEGIQYRGYDHVAEIVVASVSDSSAVCDILSSKGELKIGQAAFLTPESVQNRHQSQLAADEDKYPIVVTFSYGDPLDEEIREAKEGQETRLSPMQRLQGRIGLNYGNTNESGGLNTRQVGLVIDANMMNLGGTYWNFTGNWRGNFGQSISALPGAPTQTLTDLVNRTYHIGFTYSSPYSPSTVGIGRLFVPWAPSLGTIDGGYYGRKVTQQVTVGVLGGSTPDPSSWSYNPNQHIAGAFVNIEHGSFDHFRVYSTLGVALTSIQWKVARQFLFADNNWSWKNKVSFYNSAQADAARTSPLVNGGSNPTQLTQSFSSLHFQPIKLFGFGVNDNYFRTLPTFDPRLLGTGLLDRYLFQGLSGDVRFDFPKHIALFASLGQAKTTTDKKKSYNDSFGISMGNIWRTGIFADAHISRFNSSFGSGTYEAFSLSKNITDTFRIQAYGGIQKYLTTLSNNTKADFVNGVLDWNVGSRYFLEGNYGWYQGTSLRYNQWSIVFGYRLGGTRK